MLSPCVEYTHLAITDVHSLRNLFRSLSHSLYTWAPKFLTITLKLGVLISFNWISITILKKHFAQLFEINKTSLGGRHTHWPSNEFLWPPWGSKHTIIDCYTYLPSYFDLFDCWGKYTFTHSKCKPKQWISLGYNGDPSPWELQIWAITWATLCNPTGVGWNWNCTDYMLLTSRIGHTIQ
jgi:hypothetical protein